MKQGKMTSNSLLFFPKSYARKIGLNTDCINISESFSWHIKTKQFLRKYRHYETGKSFLKYNNNVVKLRMDVKKRKRRSKLLL